LYKALHHAEMKFQWDKLSHTVTVIV